MKLALSLITVMLWALLAVACSSTPSADPRKLVPSDANVVAEIMVADILKDPDLVKLYNAVPKGSDTPQTFEELLASSVVETGLDVRTIRTAVVFSDSSSPEDYTGAVLKGRFDAEELLAALGKTSPGATETRYKNRQVYLDRAGDSSQAFALLSKELLVAGTLPAVQRVIDVHTGDQAPLSGRVWDTFQSLGTPLFRLAAEVPSGALSGSPASLGAVPGLGAMPLGAEALDSLEIVGVAVDKTGQNLKLRAQLHFRDASSADRVEGLLSGGLSLLRGLTPDPQVRDVLDQVQVKVSGARLDILLQASVSDLQALAASSGGRQ
jgi:hypothetical protein